MTFVWFWLRRISMCSWSSVVPDHFCVWLLQTSKTNSSFIQALYCDLFIEAHAAFLFFYPFRFRDKMTQAGFTIAGSAHPICPVMLGDARLASLMADDMLKLGESQPVLLEDVECEWISLVDAYPPSTGVYVIGFSYPVVPKGKARIRVQISAAHTEEDIDHCVDAFIQTGRKHGVVSWGRRTRRRQDESPTRQLVQIMSVTEESYEGRRWKYELLIKVYVCFANACWCLYVRTKGC